MVSRATTIDCVLCTVDIIFQQGRYCHHVLSLPFPLSFILSPKARIFYLVFVYVVDINVNQSFLLSIYFSKPPPLGKQILRWNNNAGFSEGSILRLTSEKGRCQSDGELGFYSKEKGAEPLFLCGDILPHEGYHRKEASRNNPGFVVFFGWDCPQGGLTTRDQGLSWRQSHQVEEKAFHS